MLEGTTALDADLTVHGKPAEGVLRRTDLRLDDQLRAVKAALRAD
jgi:hypothetical protein